MDMILCPECGASNPLEAAACESCGADLSAVKSVLDTANEHYNEALALAHAGRLDEAIGQLEAALALNGQNPNYHNLLGTIYAQKGLFSEAIRAWERCLSLDSETEKAYNNIEKARRMEEDAAEDRRRRPFLLAAIGAGAAAAVFFAATVYFGLGNYFKSSEIARLSQEMDDMNADLLNWRSQYQSISKVLPAEGINSLLQEIEKNKALAEERQKQIDATKDQYQRIIDRRQEQIQSLNNQLQDLRGQIAAKDQELQKVNQLQTVINTNQNKMSRLEQQLEEVRGQLETEQARAKDLRDRLVVAQETIESVKQDRDRALANLRKGNEALVDDLRKQVLALREELATKERRYTNLLYAGGLVAEAMKNLEANQFQIAYQNVQNAISSAPDSPAAKYLQEEIQSILNDPLEQELRRQEAQRREAQREEKRQELVRFNLDGAREAVDGGRFDQAIELARRAQALARGDGAAREASEIIGEAEEQKSRVMIQLLEAESLLSNQDFRKAESILRDVLKRSPQNERALELMGLLSGAEGRKST